jgi:prepilin-type N-terminal cleavage/methylation domain-containing protein
MLLLTPLPARRISRPTTHTRQHGFSVIELLAVIAIISTIAGIGGSALRFVGSNGLTTGTRTLAGFLTMARSEAIARHAVVRFAIATPSAEDGEAGLRKVSLWAWSNDTAMFEPITKWEALPTGVILEPQLPAYLREAKYAVAAPATVKGDCVLADDFEEAAEYTFRSAQAETKARYLEFMPSGNIRIPGGTSRQAILVATEGNLANDESGVVRYTSGSEGRPTNWAQINIDRLTGRVRVYQP